MQQIDRPVSPAIEKIAQEAAEAGCTQWDILRVVNELEKESPQTVERLRDRTFEILLQVNPKAAQIYASFNRMQVHTSAERIEPFDRGNIVKSLLKETAITRGVAEKIGHEVEDKIKDLKISYLNTALIRHLATVKLLEYGHEPIYQQYQRLGMPVSDVKQKLSQGFFENKEILREYNFLHAIPSELREMHFGCDISISNVEDFSTKPFSYSVPQIANANSINDAAVSLIKSLRQTEPFISMQPNVSSTNVLLSKFLDKFSAKKLQEAAKFFVSLLGANYKASEEAFMPSVGIDLFIRDTHDDFSKLKNTAFNFAGHIIDAYAALPHNPNFQLIVCLDSKYKLKLLENQNLAKKGMKFLNCNDMEFLPLNGDYFTDKSNGLLMNVAINLPSIASATANEKAFNNKLAQILDKLEILKTTKLTTLEEKKYLKDAQISPGSLKPALSLFNLFEASAILLESPNEKELLVFSEKIVQTISERLGDNWLITDNMDEPTATRFNDFNSKRFTLPQQAFSRSALLEKSSSLHNNLQFRLSVTSRKHLDSMLTEGFRLLNYVPA